MLKLDPKNAELLKQKQDILNSSISTTEEKLKQLQKIKEEADKKMSNGTEINAENYRALQREIINTQRKLSDLKNENSGWNKAGSYLTKLGNELDTISSKVDSLGNKLTTRLSLPVVAGFTIMTKSAIETETAMQQVDRIYGEAAESIKDFAENKALDYNMSASEAYKYSQIYGNLIQSITDDQAENAEQTQKLLQASSVIASATGRSMEDVMDRIRSGLLGNTEAIEDLGVNVNVALLETTDAFKQIAGDRSWEQLTFQEQQQIRLLGILEQTSKKYGDEVQENTASSIQKLTAKTKNLTSSLGKKLLPVANKILDKANNLMEKFEGLSDEEQENIIKTGLMVAAAGPLLKIGSKGITIIGGVTKGLGTFTKAIGLAKNGIGTATGSAATLAKVFQGLTSPLGLLTTGITATVGALIYFKNHETEAQKEARKFAEEMSNAKKSLEEYNDNIDKTAEANLSHINSVEKLNEELRELVDENGKVKEGNKERAEFILEKLNEALGTEYKLNEGIIEQYQNMQDEIDSLIEKKRAEIILNADEEKYKNAIENQKQAVEDLRKAKENLGNETIENLEAEIEALSRAGFSRSKEVEELKNMANAYRDAESRVKTYTENVQQYQEHYEQFLAGNYEAINTTVTSTTQNWCEQTTSQISTSIAEQAKLLTQYKNIYETTGNEVALENQQQAKKNLDILTSELVERSNNIDRLGKEEIEAWANLAINSKDTFNEEIQKLSPIMQEQLKLIAQAIEEDENVKNNISILAEAAEKAFTSNDSSKWGYDLVKGLADGMLRGQTQKLNSAVSGVANKIKSMLHFSRPDEGPLRDYETWMPDMVKGLSETLTKSYPILEKSVKLLSEKLKNNLQPVVDFGQYNKIGNIIDQTKTVFTTPTLNIYAQDELTSAKINTIIDTVNKRLGSKY